MELELRLNGVKGEMYELFPRNGRQSFYGKAKVFVGENGDRTLISYDMAIVTEKPDGSLIRLFDGWSQTTGHHIKSFCGLNKQEFFKLPLYDDSNIEQGKTPVTKKKSKDTDLEL